MHIRLVELAEVWRKALVDFGLFSNLKNSFYKFLSVYHNERHKNCGFFIWIKIICELFFFDIFFDHDNFFWLAPKLIWNTKTKYIINLKHHDIRSKFVAWNLHNICGSLIYCGYSWSRFARLVSINLTRSQNIDEIFLTFSDLTSSDFWKHYEYIWNIHQHYVEQIQLTIDDCIIMTK